jgi:hypothetical protein
MRTHVGRPSNGADRVVHDGSDDPLIDPSAAGTEKQGRRRMGSHECGPSLRKPAKQGSLRGHPVGNCALLCSLTEYPHKAPLLVEVANVKAA